MKSTTGTSFSKDGNTLLMFMTPVFGTGSTGENENLIRILENELQQVQKEYPSIRASYFGGPRSASIMRQIKKGYHYYFFDRTADYHCFHLAGV